MKARLVWCNPPSGSSLIWSAEVSHGSMSADEVLVELRRRYQKRFGEVAGYYAAPSFLALRDLLHLTPRPKLTREEDVMEKIMIDYE